MRSLVTASVAVSVCLAFLGPALTLNLSASPHGGQYRGPGNTVPPGSGSSGGSSTGSTSAPTDPGTSAPSQPSPASSPPPAGATSPGRGAASSAGQPSLGVQVGEDLSKWQYWWEFNKDAYLLLKQSLREPVLVAGSDEVFMGAVREIKGQLSARPSESDITERILPALHRALTSTQNRDIVSACLIGLAKIGREHKTFDPKSVFRRYLTSRDQEIRETAALAMGISQLPGTAKTLMALAADADAGRKLTDRARVDARTRSFASYGLGLIAYANRDPKLQAAIFSTLKSILVDASIVDRNVKVAAINAMSLIAAPAPKLHGDLIRALLDFYDTDAGRGKDVIRAHVPPAVARILGRSDSKIAGQLKQKFAAELHPGARRSNLILRSAVLALGQMVVPGEKKKKGGATYSRVLQQYFDSGKDSQTRYFSLISLAEIGGKQNRSFLLKVLAKGSRLLEKPWAGVALGLMVRRQRSQGGAADELVAHAIHKAFGQARTPYVRGAMAIGLGLCGHTVAGEDILGHLRTHGHQDEMSGYLCVGLALMGYKRAKEPIVDLLDTSIRRPHRLRMAAVALGKLGDRRLTRRLMVMLEDGEPNLAKMAAVANALAQIGDRESLDPLCKMLMDEDLPNLTRAFAAVALGGIADKEMLPWNAKIAVDMNYRAAVETLVESGSGVLEIL